MSKASEEEFESDIIYSGLLSGYSEARNTCKFLFVISLVQLQSQLIMFVSHI